MSADPKYKVLRLSPVEYNARTTKLDLGQFDNIVVCTGAGVSVNQGILPYRAPGGILDKIKDKWGDAYPRLLDNPQLALSRIFHNTYPEFCKEFWVWFNGKFDDIAPGPVHNLCHDLFTRGKLQRVYTQNVDGLHDHDVYGPEFADKVVNFHGRLDTIVLYGDPICEAAYTNLIEDFEKADLVLVIGTTLQVTPFNILPNLIRKGAARCLINKPLMECLRDRTKTPPAKFCGQRVITRNLWRTREALAKWDEYWYDGDCDELARHWRTQLSN